MADTYEAVFTGVEEDHVAVLKDLLELARVGEYYLLGQEHSGQGYNASYVYCDSDVYLSGETPENTGIPDDGREILESGHYYFIFADISYTGKCG